MIALNQIEVNTAKKPKTLSNTGSSILALPPGVEASQPA